MTKIKKTTPSKTNNIITMAEKGMWIKQTGSTKRKRDDTVTLPSFTKLTQSDVQINQAGVCFERD